MDDHVTVSAPDTSNDQSMDDNKKQMCVYTYIYI